MRWNFPKFKVNGRNQFQRNSVVVSVIIFRSDILYFRYIIFKYVPVPIRAEKKILVSVLGPLETVNDVSL